MRGRKREPKLLVAATSSLYMVLSQCTSVMAADNPTTQNTQPVTGSPTSNSAVSVIKPADAGTALNVQSGQTVAIDFGTTNVLNLLGNFNNQGTVYLFSSNPNQHTATVSALNINNATGALLSTTLPTGGIPGVTSFGSLNLVLQAINNIVNQGTISSGGSLAMTAGGSITNGSTSNTAALLQATNNLSMQAANIFNSGTIQSQLANLNLNTSALVNQGLMQAISGNIAIQNLLGSTLSINNTGGTIKAGNDLVLSALSATNTTKSILSEIGGLLAAKNLNLSATGQITIDANQINGLVNAKAGSATLGVAKGDLNIGTLNTNSGPVVYDTAGSLVLNAPLFSSPLAGKDFVFLAGNNISTNTTGPQLFSTAGTPSQNGQVTLAAGVTFTPNAGSTLHPIAGTTFAITGNSATGGSIQLPNVSFVTNGKNFTATAHSGTKSDGHITLGNVTTSALQSSGNGGNISVVADGGVTTGSLVANGFYATKAGASGGNAGNIFVQSAACGIDILGNLLAFGGNAAAGLAGKAGGNGGAGGLIQLASANGICVTGNVISHGGDGANGGDGLAGCAGGNGGRGGDGGKITITSTCADVNLNCTVESSAGNGGKGGAGGDGEACGGAGGKGGNGGAGGDSSDIVIFGARNVTVGNVSSIAGNGGSGGAGGDGTYAVWINPPGGNGGNGGNGGHAGFIHIDAPRGCLAVNGVAQSLGGNGGKGGEGGKGAPELFGYCLANQSAGGNGGNGGTGGGGQDIWLTAGNSLDTHVVITAAGNGGTGGKGGQGANCSSTGWPFWLTLGGDGGNGGNGGNGGSAGLLQLTSLHGNVNAHDFILNKGGDAGNGGIGGNGGGLAPHVSACLTCFGGNGGTGGNGGKGGSSDDTIITACSNIVAKGIFSEGGNGGNGGAGGNGGPLANGGNGGCGGNAGTGDFIHITAQNGSVHLLDNVDITGGQGGNGGNGGYGGTSYCCSTHGGNGGNFGDGGDAHDLRVWAKQNITTENAVESMGGNGGRGGNAGGVGSSGGTDPGKGGAGGYMDFFAQNGCITLNAPVVSSGGNGGDAGNGANGGAGGDGAPGGNGGDINITSHLSIVATDVKSIGGNGGKGGNGGDGNVCSAAGRGGNGANGGYGGAITMFTDGDLTVKGSLLSLGGNGGAGGNGGDAPPYCTGGSGGIGGNGGNGNQINLFNEGVMTVHTVIAAAGAGGNGGNGGCAVDRWGSGGAGGKGGNGGNADQIQLSSDVAVIAIGDVASLGGRGGNGGDGGLGGKWGYGGNGGKAGNGGNAGPLILYSVPFEEHPHVALPGTITAVNLISTGGNGGNGGAGGSGWVTGNKGAGGNGGDGGPVAITASNGATVTGFINNSGGQGGNGKPAGSGGSAGRIDVISGTSFSAGNITSQGFGPGSHGGFVTLTAPNGNITLGHASMIGVGGANGGNFTSLSKNLSVTHAGQSIDVSALSGNAGNVRVTTTSSTPFQVGAVSSNGTAGDILALGINGGKVTLVNTGGQKVGTGAVILANGTTGSGGTIQFAGSGSLNVVVNGTVSATNNSGKSGIVGINSGTQNMSLTGTGKIQAGASINLGNLNSTSLNLLGTPSGTLLGPIGPTTVGPVHANFTNFVATNDTDSKQNEEDHYQTVGYVSTVAGLTPATQAANAVIERGKMKLSKDAVFKAANGGYRLARGEAVITPDEKLHVEAGPATLEIAAGSIVNISNDEGVVKVRNVFENHGASIKIIVDGRSINLSAGQEAVISRLHRDIIESMVADGIARRAIRYDKVGDGYTIATSEFSLVSAFNNNELTRSLVTGEEADAKLRNKMLKMAACLQQVTAARGAYQQVR